MNEAEITLIRQCQSGCQKSLDQLYRNYHPAVLRVTRKVMGNEQDAEDAMQEVFARVLKKVGQFRFEASFSAWLRILAVNVCRDMLRKKNRHPTESIEDLDTDSKARMTAISSSISQEEELIMKELLENLQEKIALLKKQHQRLIVLRYIDGLSYKKMAELLDCSQTQVKSRLHQARKQMRRVCQSLRVERELQG